MHRFFSKKKDYISEGSAHFRGGSEAPAGGVKGEDPFRTLWNKV